MAGTVYACITGLCSFVISVEGNIDYENNFEVADSEDEILTLRKSVLFWYGIKIKSSSSKEILK